ncbi:hypothetical protein ACIOFV_52940, partial [Streptomyces mirabilis]|uniref:hypothetical protein n=1 Tax=Streptomyces mirabilis TaxID=68239 RepID=UPI00382AA067
MGKLLEMRAEFALALADAGIFSAGGGFVVFCRPAASGREGTANSTTENRTNSGKFAPRILCG